MRSRTGLRGVVRALAAGTALSLMVPLLAVAPASADPQGQIAITSVRVDTNGSPITAAGTVLEYTLTVTNTSTGGVTLEDSYITAVLTSDPNVPVPIDPDPDCYLKASPKPTLAENEQWSCNVRYTVTQADMNTGSLSFDFRADASWPPNSTVDQNITPRPPIQRSPAIQLTKTAAAGSTFSKPGDVITYSLVATNTGNVTLTNVQIEDPKVGPLSGCQPSLGSSLLPGAAMTCSAQYAVDQTDVDAGQVYNPATTTGTSPPGTTPSSVSDDADATVPGEAKPAIKLVKTADAQRFTEVGQKITYTLVATNTGNQTLTNVVITDPLLGGELTSCTPAKGSTLNVGASMSCTGEYVATEADAENGQLTNTAIVTGLPPGGKPPVTDEDTVTIPGPLADLAITKTHSQPTVLVGQDVDFTLTVRNLGPSTSYGVKVTDTLPSQLEFVSATGDGWTCTTSGKVITCTLATPLAAGATSLIAVKAKAVAADSQIVNVAVVEAKTQDPNPDNNRAEDLVGVTKDSRVCPTDVINRPGGVVIPGCPNVQIRVLCKVKKPSAAGQISYCRVKQRKNGSVRVVSRSQYPVKVKVIWFAKPTAEYKGFRKVKTFTLPPTKR